MQKVFTWAMLNRRQFIKGILALAVIPQIPFVGVKEVVQPDKLKVQAWIHCSCGQDFGLSVYDVGICTCGRKYEFLFDGRYAKIQITEVGTYTRGSMSAYLIPTGRTV